MTCSSPDPAAGPVNTGPSAATVLAVEDLCVDIPTPAGDLHAVQGVGFTLEKGKTLGIVGESGCGKSVTTLATVRLLPPRARIRARRLEFAGIDLRGLSERAIADIRGDRIAMIFQEPMTALNPVFTIGDQLMEPFFRHRAGSRAQAREKALYLLDRVGIPTSGRRLGLYPHQLSGGLRQRVMIAMALMCDPDVIIADEPTTALDVTIQAQILGLLAELQEEAGAAMIFVSHDLGVISRVADHVLVMYAGREVESGTVRQVFSTPLHPYTQGLFACIPVPGKKPRYAPLGSIPGVVPSLLGDREGCMFRPRCDLAHDACTRAIPYLALADGHRALCTAPLAELRARAEKAAVR